MATAIGVVSGVLGIFSFLQEMFPEPDRPQNTFRFRIGLDGTTPPGDPNGPPLSDAGGQIPDLRCFNEVGNFLGITVNDGNSCGEGSEACESTVETDNACSYVLFTGNPDAICIGWASVQFPGGDKYGSPIGNWAQTCAEQFGTGGTWYWSNVLVQVEGQGGQAVQCAWIDEDGDQPTTGIQIHWPEFNGEGGAIESLDYYCANNPSLIFRTDPAPNDVTYWIRKRRFLNRSDDPDFAMSPAVESPVEKQRRETREQHTRLSRRFAENPQLVKSSNSDHDASTLCGAKFSVGPSFVSYTERQFCEMQTKTVYPFCEDVESGNCWADAQNAVIAKQADGSASISEVAPVANFNFSKVTVWDSPA